MTTLDLSKQFILNPGSISFSDLDRIMQKITKNNVDYADLYFQYSKNEFWSIEDSAVNNGTYSIDQGVGIRSVSGEKSAFTYSDDININALDEACKIVNAIKNQGQSNNVPLRTSKKSSQLYSTSNPLESLDSLSKIKLLEKVEQIARSLDPRIKKVSASLAAQYEIILIKNFHGQLIEDVRPLVRLSISVIAEADGKR